MLLPVGGVGAFEDTIGIYRRLSEQVGQIDTVGYQAALVCGLLGRMQSTALQQTALVKERRGFAM
jgi:hypothetical protein